MSSGDLYGVLAVYIYVALLLITSEKVLKRYPLVARKFLHIMVGNIFFILPLFDHAWVMAGLAAAPFIPLTFLMSPHSPLRLSSRTSASGHGMGLVYYSISWTILAYCFFDTPHIIALGIVAMSYGDGFASLLGRRFGRRQYHIWKGTKSFEGSLSMFMITFLASILALAYYGVEMNIPVLIVVSLIGTFIEAITPGEFDNLSVPLISSFLYLSLM